MDQNKSSIGDGGSESFVQPPSPTESSSSSLSTSATSFSRASFDATDELPTLSIKRALRFVNSKDNYLMYRTWDELPKGVPIRIRDVYEEERFFDSAITLLLSGENIYFENDYGVMEEEEEEKEEQEEEKNVENEEKKEDVEIKKQRTTRTETAERRRRGEDFYLALNNRVMNYDGNRFFESLYMLVKRNRSYGRLFITLSHTRLVGRNARDPVWKFQYALDEDDPVYDI